MIHNSHQWLLINLKSFKKKKKEGKKEGSYDAIIEWVLAKLQRRIAGKWPISRRVDGSCTSITSGSGIDCATTKDFDPIIITCTQLIYILTEKKKKRREREKEGEGIDCRFSTPSSPSLSVYPSISFDWLH